MRHFDIMAGVWRLRGIPLDGREPEIAHQPLPEMTSISAWKRPHLSRSFSMIIGIYLDFNEINILEQETLSDEITSMSEKYLKEKSE